MTKTKLDSMFTEFSQQLKQLTSCNEFVVAFSGGLDSRVLLDLMVKVVADDPVLKLRAVHVNHQLNSQAKNWSFSCQQMCQDLKVLISVCEIDVNCFNGESVEAKARQLRYAVLEEQLQPGECLLTAHHQDDQAETLLLQLIRGAGPKGLSAMPVCKKLAGGALMRPLLNFTQAQLRAYAQAHSLEWVEDDSNLDTRFARNYMRHHVLPILMQRWPQTSATLARSAAHCAEQCELVDELAVIDLAPAWCDAGMDKIKLSPLLALPLIRQSNALRYWLAKNNCLMPSKKQLAVIVNELMAAQSDALPVVKIGVYQVRRYQDYLYVMPCSDCQHDATWQHPWNLQAQLPLPAGLGVLSLVESESFSLRTDFAWDKIHVRFRQGGERIRLHEAYSRSLKNLFQQWQVPPWQRDRVPLLFFEDQLIVVVGYAIASQFKQMCAGKVVALSPSMVVV